MKKFHLFGVWGYVFLAPSGFAAIITDLKSPLAFQSQIHYA